MDTQLVATIVIAALSSSFLAAILTSSLSIYQNRKNFENDYFKEVIQRRLAAYQTLERVIASLKMAGVDGDGDNRTYHLVFAMGWAEFTKFHQNLMAAISQGLWVSDETNSSLVDLGRLMYAFGLDDDSDEGLKEVAKQRYSEIATFRQKLETSFRTDFVQIHRVKKFLRQKRNDNSFQLVDLRTGKQIDG